MSLTKQQVTALYIAVYNRAPDAAGLEFWTNADVTYAQAAEGFVDHPVFEEEYGDLSNQEVIEKFYTNILGSEGDVAGIEWWVARLDAGEDIGVVLSEFLDISLNGDFTGDIDAIARQDTLKNKVKVGLYYAEQMGDASNMGDKYDPNSAEIVNDPAFQNAQDAIANVDNTNASVVAAQKAIDALVSDIPGETFYLDTGRDVLTGTDNADTFVADIIQNQNGQQVNTLGSGDRLDGGEGNDTLLAEVTQGAYVGGGNQQIQPKTVSIENIKLQSVASSIGGASEGVADQVYVNAKDMLGVNYIGSERSNADLIITDLTSKDNNGDMRDTADMTVGMKYTGNGNTDWDAANLNVYFDQDYLTRDSGFSRPSVDINVMNEDAYDETDGEFPLAGVFLRELTVTVNGERFDLTQYMGENANGTGEEIKTYDDLLTAIQNAIVDLQNANPDNDALQTLQASLNGQFYSDIDPDTGVRRVGDSIKLSVSGESNGKENTLTVESTDLELARTAYSEYGNNNRYERADNQPAVQTDKLVAINVELEKAGLAGDGGELVIGSMNKGNGDTNTWNPADVNTVGEGTVSGIEQFNVTVSGNKSQSSSIAGLRSTNNNLREVYVGSDQGSTANLTIGNSNTLEGYGDAYPTPLAAIDVAPEDKLSYNAAALKDVQIFDASAFNGDLNLSAALTGEVTEKYLANGDGEFVYTGGTGNDTIDLAISAANLTASGTATHGDFTLEINGGAGNDTITVGIYDEFGLADAGDAAWYANQKTNENLSINAGNGDDTVNLQGSGDWVVDLGAGDDVIYVDNGGEKASFIFNLAEGNTPSAGWADAIGGGNPTYDLYKAGVTLTFTDATGGEFELNLVVNPDKGHQTTQQAINEAIKNAIENDTVFSKLLEAKTGQMAHTLIIDSLIDGATELSIEVEQLAAGATDAVRNAFNTKYGTNIGATEIGNLQTQHGVTFEATGANQPFSDDQSATEAGNVGDTFGAQTITGGKGDDVLVLGTSADQAHTLVYEGYDNGTDTIVNFVGGTEEGAGNRDVIDLTSYEADHYATFTSANDAAIQTSIFGGGATVGQTYVVFNQNADNDGEYTVTLWEKGATDAETVKLGTIGVMDFGDSVVFDAAANGNLAL